PSHQRPLRECAMAAANGGSPEGSVLLEVTRRVTLVLFGAFVGLIRELLDVLWQGSIARPEGRRRVVSQRGLVLPLAWSRRACSARASSLPARTSCSIWRSHAAQSNSRNQARNCASSSGESAWTCCSIFSTLPMTTIQCV